MLKMDVYPVLSGVELWVTGLCLTPTEAHSGHQRVRVATYVDSEELATYGVVNALARAWEQMLHEYPVLASRSTC